MSYNQFEQYGNAVKPKSITPDLKMQHYFTVAGRVAAQFSHRLPSQIEMDDVVQIATLALLELQKKHLEENKELNEGTVVLRVRGAIIDAMRNNDWVPRRAMQNKARIVKTFKTLTQQLLREPSSQEMADALGISLNEYFYDEMELSQACLFSLNALEDDNGDVLVYDSSQVRPEIAIGRAEIDLLVQQAIATLDEKEQLFVTLFYQELMNQKEISLILDCSEASVSRIHGRVLLKLSSKVKSITDYDD